MKVRIPNSGGPGNMNQMLAQAQKMQADMAALQEELEARTYTASAGNGMVEVTVDGKHRITAIHIQPDCVDPEDVEMLEDLVTVAVNEAVEKAAADSEQSMASVTGGLNIPGLL